MLSLEYSGSLLSEASAERPNACEGSEYAKRPLPSQNSSVAILLMWGTTAVHGRGVEAAHWTKRFISAL